MLSLAEYKELFDKVKEYALVVSFYNHGEPLLNPDVFSIIEHTHRNRVGTNISSNFNWPQPVEINDFIRSGLDYVTVSLDGITQATYQQYRVRGDVAEVFDNLKAPFGEEGSEVQNPIRRVAVHRLQAQRARG
jgi:MoaA/NifB/PqqE/SkfB family radical SAM enzyme